LASIKSGACCHAGFSIQHKSAQVNNAVCRPSARRSICEVQTKVTRTYIDVHAALSKDVATNQNVIGRELIEHGKVTDELNPILEPN
jgi:hypothetical protein